MKTKTKKGFALVIVLSFVVMVSAVLIAFMISVSTERSSSAGYAASVSTRHLADTTVSLVQTQINVATTTCGGTMAWVSQPGMVRTYGTTGNLGNAYKLYSANKMIDTTIDTTTNSKDYPKKGVWDKSPSVWVDLNAPILIGGNDPNLAFNNSVAFGGNGSNGKLVYPILDPTALSQMPNNVQNAKQAIVAGNTYNPPPTIYGLNGAGFSITNPPTAVADAWAQAPMPVQWLYVLADGQVVAPSVDPSTVNTGPITIPGCKSTNPVVGRIAFWADDETCKVNINTASGATINAQDYHGQTAPGTGNTGTAALGTYWDVPRTWTMTEVSNFAINQPANGEFQRYPGHPATVSLAALFPEIDFKLGAQDPNSLIDPNAIGYSELLFYLTPRVMNDVESGAHGGGYTSQEGTQSVYNKYGGSIVPIKSDGMPLYSSVDEMVFDGTAVTTGPTRAQNGVLSKEVIESRRFFLTAQSRAPETNLFNLPRIASWPVYLISDPNWTKNYTNAFDRTITFCSSTGTSAFASPYIFQRQKALSTTYDYASIPRNQELYTYLEYLTSQPIPGFGGSFTNKYGGTGLSLGNATDCDCILTQIFDYIRCTNLFDDQLGSNTGHQFTPDWPSSTNSYATGHGFVAPIQIPVRSGTTMGQGRYPTLKQLTFIVIVSAAGEPQPPTPANANCYSDYRIRKSPNPVPFAGKPPGIAYGCVATGTAYSNPNLTGAVATGTLCDNSWAMYTPLQRAITGTTITVGGTVTFNSYTDSAGKPFSNDPNTNLLLAASNAGQKLTGDPTGKFGDVLVQVGMYPEFFCPSTGRREIQPNMVVEIEGADGLKLNGKSLQFPTTNGFGGSPFDALVYGQLTSGMNSSPGFGGSFGSGYALTGRYSFLSDAGCKKGGSFTPVITGTYSPVGTSAGAGKYPWISKGIVVPQGWTHPVANLILGGVTRFGGNATLKLRIRPDASKYMQSPSSTGTAQEFTIYVRDIDIQLPTLPLSARYSLDHTQFELASSYWSLFADGISGRRGTNPNTTKIGYGGNTTYTSSTAGSIVTATTIYNYTLTANSGPETANASGTWEGDFYGRFNGGAPVFSGSIYGVVPGGGPMYLQTSLTNIVNGAVCGDQGSGNCITGTYQTLISYVPNPASYKYDYRLIAAKPTFYGSGSLTKDDYRQHPLSENAPSPGNNKPENAGIGYDDKSVPFVSSMGILPWTPYATSQWATKTTAATSPGDTGSVDQAPCVAQWGAFINKPEEGDTNYMNGNGVQRYNNSYIPYYYAQAWSTGNLLYAPSFFTPNRIIPSPVMFGSLPTGVASTGVSGSCKGWQTLLFRPDPANQHPSNQNGGPKDHLFLDLFWMPVVEPYPISDRFSTAGKINLNWQILPFTYIERSTGIRAVLMPEKMMLLSNNNTTGSLLTPDLDSGHLINVSGSGNLFGQEDRYPININETMKNFMDTATGNGRFLAANSGTLHNVFISPSEICDVLLVPQDGASTCYGGGATALSSGTSYWGSNYARTAENVRQHIYATIYPKLTTKSNTYTVHFRVQALKQSTTDMASAVWNEGVDTVTGEYRGSTLIERFLNPDAVIPDYANKTGTNASQPVDILKNYSTLDKYYKWRVLQNTQFAP